MTEEGFIKISRKIISWGWFKDVNTAHLFMYCLMRANYKDMEWRGVKLKRGSFITSLKHLSDETGLTQRQVRTALEHLISTNEVTKYASAKNTVIIVNNYDKYQSGDKENDKKTTKQRQSTDKVPTKQRQSTDKVPTKQRQGSDKVATTDKKEKKYSPPLREENTAHAPERPDGVGLGAEKAVSVAEIRRFAKTVYGGDAYNACDFRRAFINSGTKFPSDWKDIFTRFAAADSKTQVQFLADVEAGKYLEKWGAAD